MYILYLLVARDLESRKMMTGIEHTIAGAMTILALRAGAQAHVLAVRPVPGEREGTPLRHGAGTAIQQGPEGRAGAERVDRGPSLAVAGRSTCR